MIAIGFSWFDHLTNDRREIVVVGSGDYKHTDRLAARIKSEVPAQYKWQALAYVKPFVDGARPPLPGTYDHGFVGWWKPVEVL